eukprot:497077-Pleurochrysis_carterae.AAC.1
MSTSAARAIALDSETPSTAAPPVPVRSPPPLARPARSVRASRCKWVTAPKATASDADALSPLWHAAASALAAARCSFDGTPRSRRDTCRHENEQHASTRCRPLAEGLAVVKHRCGCRNSPCAGRGRLKDDRSVWRRSPQWRGSSLSRTWRRPSLQRRQAAGRAPRKARLRTRRVTAQPYADTEFNMRHRQRTLNTARKTDHDVFPRSARVVSDSRNVALNLSQRGRQKKACSDADIPRTLQGTDARTLCCACLAQCATMCVGMQAQSNMPVPLRMRVYQALLTPLRVSQLDVRLRCAVYQALPLRLTHGVPMRAGEGPVTVSASGILYYLRFRISKSENRCCKQACEKQNPMESMPLEHHLKLDGEYAARAPS